MGGAVGLLAGGGAAAAGVPRQSGGSGRAAASFDRAALDIALALEAGAADVCARLAERRGLDPSVRRHLTAAASDARAQLVRLAPLGIRPRGPGVSAGGNLGRTQERIAALHRRTLRRLRTDEAREAFGPVLALATYRAGLLRTLEARGAMDMG